VPGVTWRPSTRAAVVLAVVILLAGCAQSGGIQQSHAPATLKPVSTHRAGTVPELRHVTGRGAREAEFEGLLHRTFGAHSVCVTSHTGGHPLRFVSGSCSPLASHAPYFFTFASTRHTTFRLSTLQPRNFGNNSEVILVRGHTVRCESRGPSRYLVDLAGTASFTLACQRPL
jgi:hypothetical protein